MPAAPTPVTNVSVSTQFAPNRPERLSLYVRNYSGSTGTMWLALGVPATAGTNGEYEIVPGGEYSWTGILTPIEAGNVYIPTDSVNIIISGGSATGAVVEYL
jgi:hypothetical protein